MIVVLSASFAGLTFVFMRRRFGLIPRPKIAEPSVISATFAVNLGMMLFLVTVLMTWALTPWKP